MFCKYCGSELSEETNFCTKCGKLHDGFHPDDDGAVVVQPIVYTEDAESWNSDALAKKAYGEMILTYSILGLSFGVTGFLSILGLVFSIIARTKLSTYREQFGQPIGRVTLGKYLSLAGIVASIVALVIVIATFSGSLGGWISSLF